MQLSHLASYLSPTTANVVCALSRCMPKPIFSVLTITSPFGRLLPQRQLSLDIYLYIPGSYSLIYPIILFYFCNDLNLVRIFSKLCQMMQPNTLHCRLVEALGTKLPKVKVFHANKFYKTLLIP